MHRLADVPICDDLLLLVVKCHCEM